MDLGSGDSDPVTEEETRPNVEPRHSQRVRRPPARFSYDEYADKATPEHFLYNVSQVVEPATLSEALKGDHAEEWERAADSEYESLMEMRLGNWSNYLKVTNQLDANGYSR